MFKRTLNLFFGILLSITSGSVMTYPIYSYYIKTKFNFSLREINLYATFINIGVWVAFGTGIIYDSLGPRISNAISLLLLPGGFLILYKLIQSSSVSLFWFLLIAIIMGQGSSLAYTNSLSTTAKNFSKKNSSNIVGLVISNCAIAPSIFTSVKTAFYTMSINSYIVFVICYGAVVIVLCLFWFDVIKPKRIDDFNDKLFYEFRQKFIVYIFGYANFISLLIFIGILLFNHIFGIEIPAFIVFILVHVAYIVFIVLERYGEFDEWLEEKFRASHRSHDNNINNNFNFGGRSVEVLVNNKNLENNNKLENIEQNENNNINNKENENDKDDYKGYSESENIGKIKDKYDFGFNNKNDDKNNVNKNEYSVDVNISKSILRQSFQQNQNINNIGEIVNEANGRISIESDNKINEEKKEEEDKDKKEEKKEEKEKIEDNKEDKNQDKEEEVNKEEDNNNENNKEKHNNNENNINNKEEKNEDTNLENSINNINNIKIKEDNNNNINNDNNESIDNGAKKMNSNDNNKENINENENSKEEEKTEKIDDTAVNYPKFSMNSSNNTNEAMNAQNNYPKFSLSSQNTEEENPYKEKENKEEKPKFSIINKENENDLKYEDNNNINNIKENKIKINEKKDENLNQNKNQIKNNNNNNINKKTNTNSDFNYLVIDTKTYFNKNENNNNNNINNITTNTNSSFLPLNNMNNNTQSIFDLDRENLDDNSENYSRCVFLLSLFRRPQIILLFIVLAFTMGSMISNINNIKYIVFSIDPNKGISSTSLDKYPLLYFAFNSLSRVVIGGVCNELMGTDETFTILIAINIIGLISQIFGFFMTKFFVYLSISFAGMTHGALMTFVPLYCRYYFNIKNLGTVLGFLTTGNAVGSIIIATLIFPHFYHKYSIKDKNGEEYCNQTKCFRASYAINFFFVLIAIILSNFIYKEDKEKKINERKEKENMYKNSPLSSSNIRTN